MLGAAEGLGVRGPLEERPGCGSEASPGAPPGRNGQQWVGRRRCGWCRCVCPPAAPQGARGSRRGRDPVLHPALAALRGAGRWSPKGGFLCLLATPAPPTTPVHPNPPSATLNSDWKHPCPLLAPSPLKTPLLCRPGSETGGQHLAPSPMAEVSRAVQCRCQIPCAPSPSPQLLSLLSYPRDCRAPAFLEPSVDA